MKTISAITYKEGNLYVAEAPEIGVASQGKNIEEALANLKEAVELYIEEFGYEETQQVYLTTLQVNTVHA